MDNDEESKLLYGNVRAHYVHEILHRPLEFNNNPIHYKQRQRQLIQPQRKKNNNSGKCYTCFPKPYVKNFQFNETENTIFHFDMLKRPFIIVTPKKHVETTFDLTSEELYTFVNDIKIFIETRGIRNYQLLTNGGQWKSHCHLHWKIKIDEDAFHRMKKDHFALISRQKEYSRES